MKVDREVVALVPPGEIWRVWDRLAPSLQKALERGPDFTLEHVRKRLELDLWRLLILTAPGKLLAWACLGVVPNDDGSKTLWCFKAGGTDPARGVEALRPAMEQMARDEGCTRLKVAARRGWLRSGAMQGWRHVADVLEKEIAP